METKGNYKFFALLEKLAVEVAGLDKKVEKMDTKLDEMRTEKAIETSSQISILKSKVDRLEWIVYGLIALIVTEGIGLIVNFVNNG